MSTLVGARRRALFRDATAARANTAVLLWTAAGWLASFALMGSDSVLLDIAGVVLCVHTMVLAAYLVHEAAHHTLFAVHRANEWAGEVVSFIAGSSYASFARIRHMHIRHHLDRADLTCFDFKGLLKRRPRLRRLLEALEWAYVPATEILMHLQVVWRPFFVRSQRRYLPRAASMLLLRGLLLVAIALWSLKALLLYVLALALQLHVLNFFDAFHHTFDQFFVAPDEPVPMQGRDRAYEYANTFTNLIASRYIGLNLLTLNFGYHNAHHVRPADPWYRLPALHRKLYGEDASQVLSLGALLGTWHRNRVRRVAGEHYGAAGNGSIDVRDFVGAHGVSFLTVV